MDVNNYKINQNFTQSSIRMCAERAFGILMGRRRINVKIIYIPL